MNSLRRTFFVVFWCSWVLFISCNIIKHEEQERPNIIFIMADDHATQAMSCYGSKINHTPNLDRLASEGVLFKNCFVTNSICAPSRASIITGKYSHVHGKVDNLKPFDGDQQTFPKLLQKAGYETAMIGKWHLDPEPQGFDFWKILTGWYGQGNYFNPEFNEMDKLKTYDGYVTTLTTDFALEWLKSRKGDKPYCLLYQHKAPHGPWYSDTADLSLYENVDIPVPDNYFDNFETRHEWYKDSEGLIARFMDSTNLKLGNHFSSRLNEAQLNAYKNFYNPKNEVVHNANLSQKELAIWKYQRYIKDYLRTVKSVDDNIGRLLQYLDESGQAVNTIVIYTSDQGFFLGEHGFWDKRLMLEESLRMPLLIRYPGMVKPGIKTNEMVLNIDFAPTLLELAGASVPADIQGRSFTELLKGNVPADWRKSMYYQYYEYPGWHMIKRHYGIRTERYKLIHYYYDVDAWELYDLEKDPKEMKSFYDDPAYAGIVKELKAELYALREKYGDSDELDQKYLKEQPGVLLNIPARTKEYPHLEHLRKK